MSDNQISDAARECTDNILRTLGCYSYLPPDCAAEAQHITEPHVVKAINAATLPLQQKIAELEDLINAEDGYIASQRMLQQRIVELEKEVPTADAIVWRKACNKAEQERDALSARVAELEAAKEKVLTTAAYYENLGAQLKELEKDKARLDWLQQNKPFGMVQLLDTNQVGGLRAALDTAIAKGGDK